MTDDLDGSITVIFQQLRAGDHESAAELWGRFFPRLYGLARKVLAGRELPLGAEDAVQKAFFNFFRRVDQGLLDDKLHRDDLWKLLSITTAQIASKQRRRENAAKRGGGKVRLESEIPGAEQQPFDLDRLLGEVPMPECDMICEDLLSRLDDDVREIAILRLAGYSNREIKDIVGRPLRSIERRLQLVRTTWACRVNE